MLRLGLTTNELLIFALATINHQLKNTQMKKLYSFLSIGFLALSAIGQSTQDVTFKVDMNSYTGTAFTGVFVNGNYNGWCGSCNALTDANKDGVWEGTFNIKADSIEYKFTLDGWKVEEALTSGTSCTKTTGGYTNRFVKLSGNLTIATVCWNKCSACKTGISKSVTFNCNMKQYTKTFTDVFVAGTFNAWSGNANKMTDPDGDKIYSTTLTLTDDSIEYKFEVDNWKDEEKMTAGTPCVKTTGVNTNRFVKLTGNKTLDNVCWASCDACATTSGLNKVNIASMNLYPNPTQGLIHLNLGLTQNETVSVFVYDVRGNKLYSKTLTGAAVNETIDMTAHSIGVYIVSVTTSKGTIRKEFVLNK